MRSETDKSKLYIALTDSRLASTAYEFATELGAAITGESGYVQDIIDGIDRQNVDTVLCGKKLADSDLTLLCGAVSRNYSDSFRIFVLSDASTKAVRLRQLAQDSRINAALSQLGIRASLNGYSQLKEALRITLTDPKVLCNLERRLYPPVSKRYGINAKTIEYNFRTLRDTIWQMTPTDILCDIFGSIDKKPTVSTLLSALTVYISSQN